MFNRPKSGVDLKRRLWVRLKQLPSSDFHSHRRRTGFGTPIVISFRALIVYAGSGMPAIKTQARYRTVLTKSLPDCRSGESGDTMRDLDSYRSPAYAPKATA